MARLAWWHHQRQQHPTTHGKRGGKKNPTQRQHLDESSESSESVDSSSVDPRCWLVMSRSSFSIETPPSAGPIRVNSVVTSSSSSAYPRPANGQAQRECGIDFDDHTNPGGTNKYNRHVNRIDGTEKETTHQRAGDRKTTGQATRFAPGQTTTAPPAPNPPDSTRRGPTVPAHPSIESA